MLKSIFSLFFRKDNILLDVQMKSANSRIDFFSKFGLISGYRPRNFLKILLRSGEMPYILFHSQSAFHIPAFMVFPGQWWIVCKYEEKTLMGQYKDLIGHWSIKKRNANRFIRKRNKRQ